MSAYEDLLRLSGSSQPVLQEEPEQVVEERVFMRADAEEAERASVLSLPRPLSASSSSPSSSQNMDDLSRTRLLSDQELANAVAAAASSAGTFSPSPSLSSKSSSSFRSTPSPVHIPASALISTSISMTAQLQESEEEFFQALEYKTQNDIETIQQSVDDLATLLRNEMMNRLLLSRAAIERSAASLLTARRAEWLELSEEQRVALEELKVKYNAVLRQSEHRGTVMYRSASLLFERKTHAGMMKFALEVFRAWKFYARDRVEGRERARKARKHCHRVLLRSLFSHWRRWSSLSKLENAVRRTQDKAAVEKARSSGAYESTITDLQLRLEEATERLRLEESNRSALEAELKKAFMRGVCALNLEAMTILRGGSLNGGDSQQAQQSSSSSASSPQQPSDSLPSSSQFVQQQQQSQQSPSVSSSSSSFQQYPESSPRSSSQVFESDQSSFSSSSPPAPVSSVVFAEEISVSHPVRSIQRPTSAPRSVRVVNGIPKSSAASSSSSSSSRFMGASGSVAPAAALSSSVSGHDVRNYKVSVHRLTTPSSAPPPQQHPTSGGLIAVHSRVQVESALPRRQ